jgi:putative ABC transport system ATP-binding protein
MDPLVSVQDLAKIYAMGPIRLSALKHVSFRIERGSFTAVMGPSGSGKSTLLNLLGCLDRPTRGRLAIDGVDVSRLNSNKLAALRQRTIGFIFQSFNLLPRLTALENVVAPTLYARLGRSVRRRRASTLLAQVGLTERAAHRPAELSGGEKQRVAIARALVNDPAIILADEPTGALDSRTGLEILALLQKLNREQGRTIILVTHDASVARHAGRVLYFLDGELVREEQVPSPLDAAAAVARLPALRGAAA